jgi:hypothetical protein
MKNGTTYSLYVNGKAETSGGSNNWYIHSSNSIYLLNRNYNNSFAGNAYLSDLKRILQRRYVR